MGFRSSEIVGGIHSWQRRLRKPRHPDRHSKMQRPQLLQPLGLLGRAGGKADPASQRRPGEGVDPQVLPVKPRLGSRAPAGAGSPPGKSTAPGLGRRSRPLPGWDRRPTRDRAARLPCRCRHPAPPAPAPGQGLARQEGLVALDVHDGVERGELGAGGHLGHPVGTGEVAAIVRTARTLDRSTTCATRANRSPPPAVRSNHAPKHAR